MISKPYVNQYADLASHHWWWQARNATVAQTIRRRCGDSMGETLDVGAGSGAIMEVLPPFKKITCLERDARVGRFIQEKSLKDSRVEWVEKSAEEMNFEEGRFDWVLMLDVLEHVKDERVVLKKIRKALKPGGFFLLTVPAMQTLWSRHDVANGHFRRYDRGALAQLLKEEMFDVVSLRYFNFTLVPPFILRRFFLPSSDGQAPCTQEYEVGIPPRAVNFVLRKINRLDHLLSLCVPIPWGTSILALCQVQSQK